MNFAPETQSYAGTNNSQCPPPQAINGNYPQNMTSGMSQMTLNDNVNHTQSNPQTDLPPMPTKQISTNGLSGDNTFPTSQTHFNSNPMTGPKYNVPVQTLPQHQPRMMPPNFNQQNILPRNNYPTKPIMDNNMQQQQQQLLLQQQQQQQQQQHQHQPQTQQQPYGLKNSFPNQMAPPQLQQQYAPPMGMPPPINYQQASGPMQYPNNNVMQHGPVYNRGPMGQQPLPQAPQNKLDPDQMPNPIQVMIENQKTSGGVFRTNQPGLLPPLITTKFITQDQGNSSPKFVRSTLYNIPQTAELLKTSSLPFSLIISPMAKTIEGEMHPPTVDFGTLGPIRCNRCKAYMSPHMVFIDAGRRFLCVLCKTTSEVPSEYYQHLDHTGQRVDKYERPELVLGTYEFIATNDYCRDNIPPKPPAFIFIIDVSYNNIKSGLVHLFCREIKEILKHLPIDQGKTKSDIKIGFITYNSVVHFYNLKHSLTQPKMMIVGDLQEMFMPLLDGFLCDFEQSSTIIDSLMEQIPKMFQDTKETETVLYPAVQAGIEALKASNCSGKLFVLNSSLPGSEAPGKLKNRDDRKVLGTDREKTVLLPQNTIYDDLGQKAVQAGCSIDLFIFNNSYVDLATIGQLAKITGGEIYKYTYFQADIDGQRLINDIIKDVSKSIAFDTIMRVRTSAGIRPTDFYGHLHMSNTTDMEIASIDCDKSIAIELKHDDKLSPEENVYIQIALLYTSCGGQRRLRILNLALLVTNTFADVFKSCDLDAIVLFFAKQSILKLLELTPKGIKENLIRRSAQILACYRKHCTSPTSAGQLILPECLKLLPLYVSCLLKNDAISGGADMTCDDRSYAMYYVLTIDLASSVSFIYPRLIPIHNVNIDETNIPIPIRSTYGKLEENGAYILENGIYLFIWLGQNLSTDFNQSVFGVQCTQQINTDRYVPNVNNPLSKRVNNILDLIMAERRRTMRVTLVRQNDKIENVFRHFLIEDIGTDGSSRYVDFLCHMHKEIKDILH